MLRIPKQAFDKSVGVCEERHSIKNELLNKICPSSGKEATCCFGGLLRPLSEKLPFGCGLCNLNCADFQPATTGLFIETLRQCVLCCGGFRFGN